MGKKQHLKRLYAPKDWMLSKMTGVFAPRPIPGPHKLRDCIPLLIVLRNRLKYVLNLREANMVLRQRFVKVDNRVRMNPKFPAGFMDVVEIAKTNDKFRVLYDVKGRFHLTRIPDAEKTYKLCKVVNLFTSARRTPVLTTSDGRRIRFPDPKIRRSDTVIVNVVTNKIIDHIKMRVGRIAMITGGANRGRVGEILSIERHPGSFDIGRLRDKAGNEFATRLLNVFVIGKSFDSIRITLPKMAGVKISALEDRTNKLRKAEVLKLERHQRAAQRRQQATETRAARR